MRFARESARMDPDARQETSPWREAGADLRQAATALVATFRSRELGPTQLALVAFNLLEWGGGLALFVFAFQVGGAPAVGLAALALQIPAAIIAPFGAVLADRVDRRRLLLLVMLTLSLLSAAAGSAMLLRRPHGSPSSSRAQPDGCSPSCGRRIARCCRGWRDRRRSSRRATQPWA